jgi:ATP-dependent DNA helicase RecG
MDLSTLDEMPKGRVKITTWMVPPSKRAGAYTWMEKQIRQHHTQAFIVCPLIEASEKENMKEVKAVKKEFDRLGKIFSHAKLGLLHGRLKTTEKDKVIEDFRSGKIDILVTTPVVEVGIDVPNATIMLVEGAERFGLAQLHQLRGRVGRSAKKSYCLILTDSPSPKVVTRLSALEKTLSGHELAELDLKLRGPGEVFGTKQSGFPELSIASWQDTDLIIATRKLAEEMVASNQIPATIAKTGTLG